MSDLISRQSVIDTFYQYPNVNWTTLDVMEKINEVPSAQPEHGRWLSVKLLDDEADFGEVDGAQCSVCGDTFDNEYWARTYFKYCPYCGSPMDEVTG